MARACCSELISVALLGPTVDTWATGRQRTRRHEHQDYLERYPNGYTCHFVRADWVLPRRTKAAAG